MNTTRGLQTFWFCVSAVFLRLHFFLPPVWATAYTMCSFNRLPNIGATSKLWSVQNSVFFSTPKQRNFKAFTCRKSDFLDILVSSGICDLSSTPKIFNINFGIATWHHQVLSCSLCSLSCATWKVLKGRVTGWFVIGSTSWNLKEISEPSELEHETWKNAHIHSLSIWIRLFLILTFLQRGGVWQCFHVCLAALTKKEGRGRSEKLRNCDPGALTEGTVISPKPS